MGDNMPAYDPAALTWLEARIGGWVADPTAIGLTSATVTDLAVDIVNARAAFTSVQTIRGESKEATTTFRTTARNMRDNASLAIAEIKSFANNSADPQVVYETANVSAPSPRTPSAPPSQPSTLTAQLNGDGSVTINFEGTGPTGTVWQVLRKLATETGYTFVGNANAQSKSFQDINIPAGTASASYQIIGVRGSTAGPISFPFTVPFGTSEGGATEMGLAA